MLAPTFFCSFISLLIGGLAFGVDPAGKLVAIAPSALAALVITSCWLPAYNSRMRLPTPSPSLARSSSRTTSTAQPAVPLPEFRDAGSRGRR